MTSFQNIIPHSRDDAVRNFRLQSAISTESSIDGEVTKFISNGADFLSFDRALKLLIHAHQAEVNLAQEGRSDHKRRASSPSTDPCKQPLPLFTSRRSLTTAEHAEADISDERQVISSIEACEISKGTPEDWSVAEMRWHSMVCGILEGLEGQKWILNDLWKESEMVVRMVQMKDPYVDVWLAANAEAAKNKDKITMSRLTAGKLMVVAADDLRDSTMVRLGKSMRAFMAGTWIPRSLSELEARIVMKPQSNTRIAWSCVGIFLMLYDLIMLPLQFFNVPEGTFIQMVAMFAQVFWTLDMALSFVTGVYKDSRLVTRLHVIARYYLSSWFLFDAIVIFPMWFLILAGGSGGFLESIRGVRYVRMVRFLRLLRLAKFNYLLQEALAAINSQVLLVILGIVKLMIWMCLLSHVNACLWYAVGNSHEKGWASEFQDKSLFYRYIVSCHWALTQFQGTSEIVPGETLGERLYAVITVLLSLLIFATFVALLTNNMMQLHKLSAEKNHNLRSVIMFLNRNTISSGLSMRVKQFVVYRQKMQASCRGHDTVIQILNADLMSELHNEIRAPALDFHIFFKAFRSVYPRLVRKICHLVLDIVAPTPGELLFVAQERGFSMYFITGGELAYTVTQRTEGELVTVANHILKHGEYLGEPALWTTWQYRGQSVAERFASTLCMEGQLFAKHVVTHPQAKVSCFLYARRFVKALAKVSNLVVSDLMNPALFIPDDAVLREWGVGVTQSLLGQSTSQPEKSTSQLEETTSQLEKSTSQLGKYPSQLGTSTYGTAVQDMHVEPSSSARDVDETKSSKMNSVTVYELTSETLPGALE